jgi:hypothetical protein
MTEARTPPDGYMRGRLHVRNNLGTSFETAEYFRVVALKNLSNRMNNNSRKSYREYILGTYDEATRNQEAQ